MNDGNAGVTLEVVKIESEDLAHLMNVHRSNDSSIVDLNAGDTVLKYGCEENTGCPNCPAQTPQQ